MPLGVGGSGDLEQLIVDLRAIPREVRAELTPLLKRAGESAAAQARGNASWSSRIPGAIQVQVRYGRVRTGMLLKVSAVRAPHARAYEGLGVSGTFRHPAWGDWEHAVTQARRPYAWPAVVAMREPVRREIAQVVEDAARRHGFH